MPFSQDPFRRLKLSVLAMRSDGFFTNRIETLAELTVRHRLSAISSYRGFPAAGGLISYGAA